MQVFTVDEVPDLTDVFMAGVQHARYYGGFFALPVWGAYFWRGLFWKFYGMRLLSVLWSSLRNDGFLKVREISFDVLFCIFSIFFIKRGYFWLKYGHFPPPPWSKFYLWKTEFSLRDEFINKDFLKSQTGASYTIRTKQRIKSCKVIASKFVKETPRATTKAKKKKEIEDVKLLFCR